MGQRVDCVLHFRSLGKTSTTSPYDQLFAKLRPTHSSTTQHNHSTAQPIFVSIYLPNHGISHLAWAKRTEAWGTPSSNNSAHQNNRQDSPQPHHLNQNHEISHLRRRPKTLVLHPLNILNSIVLFSQFPCLSFFQTFKQTVAFTVQWFFDWI